MDDFRQRILDWAKAEGLDRPARKGRKPRRKPTLSDKLAAVLLLLSNKDGSPMIPDSQRATKAEIFSVPLEWDHIIALGLEGPDAFHNMRPMAARDHKPKTKADKKRMAHNDRLRKEREDGEIATAVRRMLAPTPKGTDSAYASWLKNHPLRADVVAFPKKLAKRGKHSRPMAGGRKSKWKRTMRHGTVLREKRA